MTRLAPTLRSIAAAACLATIGCRPAAPPPGAPSPSSAASGVATVRPGLEVFLGDLPAWAAGKRVGLITNFASIDRQGRSNIDLLTARDDIRLAALFAFEHGLRGDAPPGQAIPSGVDERTGLPIHSLYGETHKPTPEMLRDIDILIYDVQDVGARPYTRVSTMALSMQAAAEKGIPFVVLDRPNPLGGVAMEGPVLDTAFASFVGMYPIPLRHGVTVGELARLYNAAHGIGADLRVVPVEGLRRAHRFDDTGLPWVGTSPNIRRLEAARLYPGTVLVEGTNLSEGRGTDTPFELVGAPWLRAPDVVREMERLGLPGIRFDATEFSVAAGARKFGGERLRGVRLTVTNPESFRPVETALRLLAVIRRLHPAEFAWTGANRREPTMLTIDRLGGTDRVRKAIEQDDVDTLLRRSRDEVAAFRARVAPYLLYR